MKKILYFLIVLSVLSCSSSKKKEEKEEAPVLPVAQVTTVHPQSFSPEELKRLELLDHYRRLREEAFAKKQNNKKVKVEKKKTVKVKRLDDQEKVLPIETTTPAPVVKTQLNDELRIQLDQHMAYYCIKFESRFSRPSDCRAHAENILKDCQDKKQTEPSLNIIQCLKKNM